MVERLAALARRLSVPLVIVGLALFALYAIVSKILDQQFTPLTQAASAQILRSVLGYVFTTALTTIVLGFVAYLLPKILPKALFAPTPKIEYGLAIFRMFDPLESDPMARIMDSVSLSPGFPYFSRESDHPSQWPPRVHDERSKIYALWQDLFGNPIVAAKVRASGLSENTVKIVGGGSDPGGEEQQFILNARQHLLPAAASQDALEEQLGAEAAARFVEIEHKRAGLREAYPNRIAILRIRNSGMRDALNVVIEIEVAGAVYDCVIHADAEQVRHVHREEGDQRITFERIPPNYTAEIRFWYRYLSTSQRVFPDKIHFIFELTQGLRISNIAASRARVQYNQRLIEEIQGYERLYIGDARKKDSYDKELAALFQKMSVDTSKSLGEYDRTHPEVRDLNLAQFAKIDIPDERIENVWITFSSPSGKRFTAVHVFKHPSGPYILLTNVDKDRDELAIVRDGVAAAYSGTPEQQITDRMDDISTLINIPQGFTRDSIGSAMSVLAGGRYSDINVSRVHYRTEAAGEDE